MNNQMMAGMNPGMNGMNLGMGMNPGMNGMNLGMGMNQGMPGMGMNGMNMYGMGMNGMNPGMLGMGMAGMNPGMGMMNPMVMGGGMMTKKQKEEYKKYLRYQGYLAGKRMAEEKKRREKGNNPTANLEVPEVNNTPVNSNSEITIKFIKAGNTTNIKMKANCMIAELLNKYSVKTGNTGNFNYKGSNLDINDCSTLAEKGMKNGDQITVS